MSDLEFHPIANLFPLIQGDEFERLKDDVRANGLHHNIVTYQGMILDGRNRYRACMAVGAQPRFVEYLGSDPFGYVARLNLLRRHLSPTQRAMIAAEMATMKLGDNQHKGGCAPVPTLLTELKSNDKPSAPVVLVSQSEAADRMNVSTRTVTSAAKVLEQGSPELIEAVKADAVTVKTAAVIADLPKAQQSEIVSEGPKAVAGAAKVLRAGKAGALGSRPSSEKAEILIRTWRASSQTQRLRFLHEVFDSVAQHLKMLREQEA
jgi:ParB-like chromosome segregation protein Spo0J